MTETDFSGDTERKGGGIRVAVLFGACVLFFASVAMMVAAPFLFRWGVVDLITAMGVLQKAALWSAVGAIGLGVVGLVLSFIGAKHRAGIVAVLVTAAAGMAAGGLYGRAMQRDDLPPIHDVQTDWNLPVAFTEATLKEREKAGAVKVRDDAMIGEDHGRWSGMSFAEAQGKFFADVKPLMLQASLPDVTRAAAKAAGRMVRRKPHVDGRRRRPMPSHLRRCVVHCAWKWLHTRRHGKAVMSVAKEGPGLSPRSILL